MLASLASFVAYLASLWAVLFWKTRRQRQEFHDRFPPISDDEFLARCPPGTSSHIALRVRRIVSEQLGVEYERVYPSSRFGQDLGAD